MAHHPRGARPQHLGALGQTQRGRLVATLERLHEQAAQAEELGLRALQHRGEISRRRALVAIELRRLRRQEQRQRRLGEQDVGLARELLRFFGVARRDRDHAAPSRAR